MMTLTHEGYTATLDIDQEANVFHGRVIGAHSVLTFEGETLEELRQAFADTVADYRDWCHERGVEPEKAYSGMLSLRITPDLHRRVAEKAAEAGESVNQFIEDRLEEVTHADAERGRIGAHGQKRRLPRRRAAAAKSQAKKRA